jgi:hypothetical protein
VGAAERGEEVSVPCGDLVGAAAQVGDDSVLLFLLEPFDFGLGSVEHGLRVRQRDLGGRGRLGRGLLGGDQLRYRRVRRVAGGVLGQRDAAVRLDGLLQGNVRGVGVPDDLDEAVQPRVHVSHAFAGLGELACEATQRLPVV